MKEAENIRQVGNLDIDFIGFIFYPKSPRYISDNKETIETIHFLNLKKVGVFVNETAEKMLENTQKFRLDFLQLHGSESPEICRFLRAEGYGVIKSFLIGSADDFDGTGAYRDSVDYLLFDTKSDIYGGSGRRFDWSMLDRYKGETPFLLSGGLSPDYRQDISGIKHPRFAGIDLNSGFEIAPGLKDVEKLQQFIQKII